MLLIMNREKLIEVVQECVSNLVIDYRQYPSPVDDITHFIVQSIVDKSTVSVVDTDYLYEEEE